MRERQGKEEEEEEAVGLLKHALKFAVRAHNEYAPPPRVLCPEGRDNSLWMGAERSSIEERKDQSLRDTEKSPLKSCSN